MKQRNIGRYVVKAELGKGGMSVVYLANDPRFGRDVAIKVLPRSFEDQTAARARFDREARVIAALEHPAIVPVYDFGEEDGQQYLVMRHMSGGSMSDVLTYGRLNLSDAVRIARRIASALDEAHDGNIIHRDLKPGNILFDSHGDAFLTDFGIVKLYEGENAQSMTGSVVLGTPAYMSPEQALGKPIDRRSDVYALGAVLYEMLTGVPPYKGPTSVSVAMKHVLEPVPNPREYRPDLAPAVVAVVEKAMAKDPEHRYQTAGELALALTEAAKDAANNEPMMPLIVVRKKAKTTSNAAQNAAQANKAGADGALVTDASVPTTEMSRRARLAEQAAEGEDEPQPQRRTFGLAAAIGIAVVALAAASVLLAISLPRLNPPSSQTPTRTPGVTLAATSTLVPTRELPQVVATVATDAPVVVPTLEVPPTATDSPAKPTDLPMAKVRIPAGGGVNIRTGPGVDFQLVGLLPGGTEVAPTAYALDKTGKRWFAFLLESEQRVWVAESVVELVNPNLVNALPLAQNVPVAPTPIPQPTATQTLVPTLSFTATPTATVTPTATLFPTPVPLPTAGPTQTQSPTPLVTNTPVPSPTATHTPTP